GIALVRHGRAAFLAAREVLFRLTDFGALQMAHFERDLFAEGGHQRQHRDEKGVPIALDHLRRDGRRFEPQAGADLLFGLGREVRERADGAGRFADSQVFRRRPQTRQVAARLFVPDGEFQTEGDGLGMYSVGTADLYRVTKLQGAALQYFTE